MKTELMTEAIKAIQDVSTTATQAIIQILETFSTAPDLTPITPQEAVEQAAPEQAAPAKKRKPRKPRKAPEPAPASNDPDLDELDDPDLGADPDPDFQDVEVQDDDLDGDLDGGDAGEDFDASDLDADLELGDTPADDDAPPAHLPAAFHSIWANASAEEREALLATTGGAKEEASPAPAAPTKRKRRGKKEEAAPAPAADPNDPTAGMTGRQLALHFADKAGMSKKDFFFLVMMEGGASLEELCKVWEELSGEKTEDQVWKNYVKQSASKRVVKDQVFTLEEADGIYAAAEAQGDAEADVVAKYTKTKELEAYGKLMDVLDQIIPAE